MNWPEAIVLVVVVLALLNIILGAQKIKLKKLDIEHEKARPISMFEKRDQPNA